MLCNNCGRRIEGEEGASCPCCEEDMAEKGMITIEGIAIRLYFNWWNKVINKEEWSRVSEETKACYRSQASEVLRINHDNICTLVDYKHSLNEFYRNKYGGIDITDIMEGEMAAAQGKTIPVGEKVHG